MLKKVVLASTLLATSLFAYKNTYIEQFFTQMPAEVLQKNGGKSAYQKDINSEGFKEANAYIFDEEKMKRQKFKDVYDNNKVKLSQPIPQYDKAYPLIAQEANRGNIIAAYETLSMIKQQFGINNKMADFKKNAERLYKHKACEGFLTYGEVYERGYMTKVDKNRAKQIYQEGLKYCKNNSFYGMVLDSNIARIDYQAQRKSK